MNYQKEWRSFQKVFNESIAEIKPVYILVPRYFANTVMRERSYCYELYHQIRCRLDISPFVLHAEIDKRGQDFIRQIFGYDPNPDFIVHQPQSTNNLVVIEVKNSDFVIEDAQNDINKLAVFINGVNYEHGIFLVYGSPIDDNKIARLQFDISHITFFWHEEPGNIPKTIFKGDWDIV